MATSHIKRAEQTLTVDFDFTAFAASVDPMPVAYVLRGESDGDEIGPFYDESIPVANVRRVTITGGKSGRVYLFGMEARTTDGRSSYQSQSLRVRDPRLLSQIPVISATDDIGNAIATESGDYLITEGGDILVWE